MGNAKGELFIFLVRTICCKVSDEISRRQRSNRRGAFVRITFFIIAFMCVDIIAEDFLLNSLDNITEKSWWNTSWLFWLTFYILTVVACIQLMLSCLTTASLIWSTNEAATTIITNRCSTIRENVTYTCYTAGTVDAFLSISFRILL